MLRVKNLPTSAECRWKWMAGSSAAATIFLPNAHAETVQITQAGSSATNFSNNLKTDYTGDMQKDCSFFLDGGAISGSGGYLTAYISSYSYRRVFAMAFGNRVPRTDDAPPSVTTTSQFSAKAGTFDADRTAYSGPSRSTNLKGLVKVLFLDEGINYDETTNGFLEVSVTNISPTEHSIRIIRLIFDDESTSAPGVIAGQTGIPEFVRAPDIEIEGKGIPIDSGDVTPRVADGTDFGTVVEGNSKFQSFRILNSGTASLTVDSAFSDSSDFSVEVLGDVVDPGDFLDFSVTFTPSEQGIKSGNISINSDDEDDPMYEFAVAGTASGVFRTERFVEDPAVIAQVKQMIKKLKAKLKKAKKSKKKAKAKKLAKEIRRLSQKL